MDPFTKKVEFDPFKTKFWNEEEAFMLMEMLLFTATNSAVEPATPVTNPFVPTVHEPFKVIFDPAVVKDNIPLLAPVPINASAETARFLLLLMLRKPLLMVSVLQTPLALEIMGALPAVGMMTLLVAAGTWLGVQFAAVCQSLFRAPVQVRVMVVGQRKLPVVALLSSDS